MNAGSFVRNASIAAAALLLVAACSEGGGAEAEQDTPRPVRVETVGAADGLAARRFVGRVDAVSTVDLSFQVGGRLAELDARQGTVVPEGTVLARLDPADYELALREAEARLELARKDVERKRALARNNTVSQVILDQAETEFRLREVALDTARRNLAYTRIEAPFDALVTRRLIDPHSNVQPHTTVLRIQDVTELRVHINVPENMIRLAREPAGYKLWAVFPDRPGERFPLEYREHATEPDQVTQTYRVSLGLRRTEDLAVLPGMTVSVVVARNGGGATETLDVPVAALAPDGQGGFRIWVFDDASGTVSPRTVEPGPIGPERVPILSGLEPGDEIVTAGIHLLRDGMRVRRLEGF